MDIHFNLRRIIEALIKDIWIKFVAIFLKAWRFFRKKIYTGTCILPNTIYFPLHFAVLPILIYCNVLKTIFYPFVHWYFAKKGHEKVRTPDSEFADLKGYPFTGHYTTMTFPEIPLQSIKVHFVDTGSGPGNREAETVILLHGSFTWSYLYRRMITQFRSDGLRVIALDFIGSGKSDKLTCADHYSYELHMQTIEQLIETLQLDRFHLVGFEWGSLLAMSIAKKHHSRVKGVFLFRGLLPNGLLNEGTHPNGVQTHIYRRIFSLLPTLNWRLLSNLLGQDVPIELYFLYNELYLNNREILSGYTAPFLDRSYKAGVMKWSEMMPFFDDDALVPEMDQILTKLKSDWDIPLVIVESLMDSRVVNESWKYMKLHPASIVLRVLDPSNVLPETHGFELAQYMAEMIFNDYKYVTDSSVIDVEMNRVSVKNDGAITLINDRRQCLKLANHYHTGRITNRDGNKGEDQNLVEGEIPIIPSRPPLVLAQ